MRLHGKFLVHLLMCLFGDYRFYKSCAIELVILSVAVAVARYKYQLYLGAESACGIYTTMKTGLAKTGPAGLLAMAMLRWDAGLLSGVVNIKHSQIFPSIRVIGILNFVLYRTVVIRFEVVRFLGHA